MELLANRLTATDVYTSKQYSTLVEHWMLYYANHPHQIWIDLQKSQYEQEATMIQSAIAIQNQQVPPETQQII
jgi:hypothetical protein